MAADMTPDSGRERGGRATTGARSLRAPRDRTHGQARRKRSEASVIAIPNTIA